MDLTLAAEEEQVVDSARQFLARALPVSRLHAADGIVNGAVRRQIAELGWYAIALPESFGGLGMNQVEEALVFREIGRGLGPTMVLSTMIAAHVAAVAGRDEVAVALIAGESTAALAVPRPGPLEAADGPAMVYDWKGADYAVAVSPAGARLIDLNTLSIAERPSLDKSVSLGSVAMLGNAVLAEAEGGGFHRRAALAVAAMQTGIAEAVLGMIVEYARIRTTFGRPIGAYQAVRHVCSDMAVRSEAARALLLYAAVALRDDLAEADLLLEAAGAVAEDAASRNVDDNIQLHGGVGITEEHDAHLFMKRARLLGQWFGSPATKLDRIAAASAGGMV